MVRRSDPGGRAPARRLLAAGIALALLLAGCRGGPAGDNGLVTVENGSRTHATLHWVSTGVHGGTGDDPVGACASTARGFGPGHVSVTVTAGTASRTVEFDAPDSGQTVVDFVITPTGEISIADDTRSRPPCPPG